MGKNGRGTQPQQPVVKLEAAPLTEAPVVTAATEPVIDATAPTENAPDAPVINNEGDAPAQNDVPAVIAPAPMVAATSLDDSITSIKMGDTEATTKEDMVLFLKAYIRCAILKKFNVTAINEVKLKSGELFVNKNGTTLKLPKMTFRLDGGFAETFPQYYERCKPSIKVWLIQSTQNVAISQEIVENVG